MPNLTPAQRAKRYREKKKLESVEFASKEAKRKKKYRKQLTTEQRIQSRNFTCIRVRHFRERHIKLFNALDFNKNSDRSFKSLSIPGKGIGMVATRDIKCGEIILQETPVLTFSHEENPNQLHERFKKLSRIEQTSVLNLHNAHPELNELIGIFETNAFDKYPAMLFLNISRLNHDCLANAEVCINESLGRVFSNQDIQMGQEICIHYYGMKASEVLATTENVTKELKSTFGFDCTCRFCKMRIEGDNIIECGKISLNISS